MIFPNAAAFQNAFDIIPVEVDTNLALCRYIKRSSDSRHEIDFSFSAVMRSFQVVLRYEDRELARITSEDVNTIEIRGDEKGQYVHVSFNISGAISEAAIRIEPEINFQWWTIAK